MEEWLTTAKAAAAWNDVIGMAGGPMCRRVTDQAVRKLCREGAFTDMGVEFMYEGGSYLVSRSSLCYFLWESAQEVSIRAERLVGISSDRRHELIGSVSEAHASDGEKMDALLRKLMHHEFLMSRLPAEVREG